MNQGKRDTGFDRLQREVLDAGLCCGCGGCTGICPSGALRIDPLQSHMPVVDESLCTRCGLCWDVCPGRGYPVVEWSKQTDESPREIDPRRGPVKQFLYGHSTEAGLRLRSASGGIATELLMHCLESGLVDEVAVVRQEDRRPMVTLTSDPAVVAEAAASKYCPVPMMELIAELRRRPRRVAVTVTPCQYGAWMRAARRLPKLADCMVLAIGLFCGQIQTLDAVDDIARSEGIDPPSDGRFLGWRTGPYPGSAAFELSDGKVIEKPLYRWLDLVVPFYSLNRCFLCPDGGNWMADMVLGDIHAGGTDETVIVCRTQRGLDALASAASAGRIEYQPMNDQQIQATVATGISTSKLMPARARNEWLARRGCPHPQFDYPPQRRTAITRAAVWQYRLARWFRGGWRGRWLSSHLRTKQRLGHFLYYFPWTIPGLSFAAGLAKRVLRAVRPRKD